MPVLSCTHWYLASLASLHPVNVNLLPLHSCASLLQVEAECSSVEMFELVYVRTQALKTSIISQIRALNRLLYLEVKAQVTN